MLSTSCHSMLFFSISNLLFGNCQSTDFSNSSNARFPKRSLLHRRSIISTRSFPSFRIHIKSGELNIPLQKNKMHASLHSLCAMLSGFLFFDTPPLSNCRRTHHEKFKAKQNERKRGKVNAKKGGGREKQRGEREAMMVVVGAC